MKRIFFSTIFAISVSTVLSQPLTDELVDFFSTTSCFVIAKKNGDPISNATGFFIKSANSTIFFVTNNHVAGLEYFIDEYRSINKRLPPDSIIPDKLTVRIYDTVFEKQSNIDINLFKDSKPTFLKFYEDEAKSSTLLDIIAIPLDKMQASRINPKWILDKSYTENNMLVSPATELFIVGFPLELGFIGLYPIWKRGTVASEANLLSIGQSRFFIDGTTRKGMSGSPVYYRMMSLDGGTTTTSRAHATYLIGIYSAQHEKGELGVVTRLAKVFEKIEKK